MKFTKKPYVRLTQRNASRVGIARKSNSQTHTSALRLQVDRTLLLTFCLLLNNVGDATRRTDSILC